MEKSLKALGKADEGLQEAGLAGSSWPSLQEISQAKC